MAEKILAAAPARRAARRALREARRRRAWSTVDGGYTHEFTTAQVHYFLEQEYGADYTIKNPQKFAVFEDHLIYADGVAQMRAVHRQDRDAARAAARVPAPHRRAATSRPRTASRPASATRSRASSSSIPGDFIQATDSHTCMGGVNNALAWGVGATEYADLVHSGLHAGRGAGVDPLRADRHAAAERHGQGRDALHPARLRASRS